MHADIFAALRRGDHQQALAQARAAVATNQQDAEAHHLLALALRANGDDDAALASVEQALALAPQDADLHFQRAGLLLGRRDLAAAQAALGQSVELDPNQFGAYILQAQLALGRGDAEEADRLRRMAERVAPEHPWVTMLEGSVALQRGDGERAVALLSKAAEQAPGDAQIRYALGFAYLKQDHLAFAEQALLGVVEQTPSAKGLHALIADIQRRQNRFADAANTVAPMLADDTATPALQRFAGEMELAAGRPDRALTPLRAAMAAFPGDQRTLGAILEAWRQTGDIDDGRRTLEAALATSPQIEAIWQGRLALETADRHAALALAERWLDALPESVKALEAKMALHAMAGEHDAADAAAQRIIAIEPGHSGGELRLMSRKLETDPAAAIAQLQGLIDRIEGDDAAAAQNRSLLQSWLGIAQDRAGRWDAAIDTWAALQKQVADQRLPLPECTPAPAVWPPLADAGEGAAAVALLWGAPGSGVERIAALLDGRVQALRSDRFGSQPPADRLQNYATARALHDGSLAGDALIAQWREALPARGVADGQIIDWLLWWDNALLLALRPQLPEATLLVALRDPRDMLLDWLAFGSPAPFALKSPMAAATWLTIVLNQVALLHEQALFPHRLLKLDDSIDDPMMLNAQLSDALETPLPAPASPIGPPRFRPGHWRDYASALAEPFAQLTPVARRLGYPET